MLKNFSDYKRMSKTSIKIAGSGAYLPGPAIPFDEVDRYLGSVTHAPAKVMKWLNRIRPLMKEMLDIEYYHYALDPLTREYFDDNISMSVKAARKALSMAGSDPSEVELITYGSAHQDQMPTASVLIQEALGIETCGEISVHANCTSAYKALLLACEMIWSGRYNNALVISSGISSSELRAEYYNQELITREELFLRYFLCDGAGALFIRAAADHEEGLHIEHVFMESIGGRKPAAMLNKRPAYWMNPKEEYEKGYHHLAQMFNEQLRLHFHDADGSVFIKGLKRMISKYGIDLSQLRYFQVNFPSRHIAELIIEECEPLGIQRETLFSGMSDMGYAGPPMVFMGLDKMIREEQFNNNDLVLGFVTEVSKFMQAGFSLRYIK